MVFLFFVKKPSKKKLFQQISNNNYKENFVDFINRWNKAFPFDYYYRSAFQIPIFSKKHLNTSFFSMICWMFEKEIKEKPIKNNDDEFKNEYLKYIQDKKNLQS